MINTHTILFVLVLLPFAATPAAGREPVEQETISIKGDQALPKILYIAPWKKVGSPLEGEAPEGRLEENAVPLEPDLFRRELELYRDGYSVD